MTTKQPNARQRILDVAEAAILSKGYSATSIEEIIELAHITKGGFFYHFKGKNALALALVERYLVNDDAFFKSLFERADELSEDPLQQMLIFLKLLAEAMADLPRGHPGCLVASFIYESLQFEDDVLSLVKQGVEDWRTLFGQRIARIMEVHSPCLDTSVTELADMLTSTIEGAVVTALVLKEPEVLPQQLMQYRNYLRLQFDATCGRR